MKEVEVNRVKSRSKLYISVSHFSLDASAIIASGVQEENFDLFWLTKLKIQAETPILEKLKHDSEQEQKIKKLERELFEKKMLVENLKRNMAEQKEEFRAREEAQARRSDGLEEALKKQSEDMTAMMKEMMEMMKKQAQP
jgi:hypothetical protein